jgi:hypothetical protein
MTIFKEFAGALFARIIGIPQASAIEVGTYRTQTPESGAPTQGNLTTKA